MVTNIREKILLKEIASSLRILKRYLIPINCSIILVGLQIELAKSDFTQFLKVSLIN